MVPDMLAAAALPHVAFARCLPPAAAPGSPAPDEDDWLVVCRRLTPRVQRVGASAALLDLGVCMEDEALGATRDLHTVLAARDIRARVGLGTTATLAQLALLAAPGRQHEEADSPAAVAYIPPANAVTFLRSVPVGALAALHPAGTVTPEMVERLRRYGLRTLGHVARLNERTLRRQFGAAAGTVLAAVARGEDPTPLCPTPAPEWMRFRPRLDLPAPPERVIAALPAVAARLAEALRRAGRRTRTIRVRAERERGGAATSEIRLREPIDDARLLTRDLSCALARLVAGGEHTVIAGLRIALGDLVPARPEQAAFWRHTGASHREVIGRLEDGLARRYGHPALQALRVVASDAVFEEHRYRAELLSSGSASGIANARVPDHAPMAASSMAAGAWRDVSQHLHWW